jgi:hypothetical protein
LPSLSMTKRAKSLPIQKWLWLPDSFDWRRRFIDQAYLLAEVVSSTDDDRIVETGGVGSMPGSGSTRRTPIAKPSS